MNQRRISRAAEIRRFLYWKQVSEFISEDIVSISVSSVRQQVISKSRSIGYVQFHEIMGQAVSGSCWVHSGSNTIIEM